MGTAQRSPYIHFEAGWNLELQEDETAIAYRCNHGVNSAAGGSSSQAPGSGDEAGLNTGRSCPDHSQGDRPGLQSTRAQPLATPPTAKGGAWNGEGRNPALAWSSPASSWWGSVSPEPWAGGALGPSLSVVGSARWGRAASFPVRSSSPRAPLGRRCSGVLAARAVARLLLWAAGLVGWLAADFSDVPNGAGIRATCSDIILRQEFLKDGFHRDLLIKVKFGESIEGLQTCRLLIKHYIPTGLYVDPYELASLREKNITEAVMVSESFNIEAPNYLSKESEVLIYARQDAQCIDCFQAFLPVHYRYHRPHRKDGHTLIVVNNPDLLMYCDEEFPVLKCWAQSEVAAPCALKSEDICQWNNMKYKSILKNLTLQVPVGLTIHTSLVCSVTLLITVLCSTLILVAVFKYGHFSL
ncbi:phosphatidylinositol-glycan biosynthesis class X protein [Nannospalax galili]|uniref:phosphatidylinositol-glycan biosynthesis class X protein n=1 Tax=Nannospalax galili TaxID=1026970 RepID=UPI0004ED4CBF|nr:phosphatidylinositol-glycan biosynthesis class X protein [Nannospalax galili]